MSVTMPRMMLMACLLYSLWPSLSWALGLGEIHLNSSLNEPLNAEIDLIAAAPDELTALRANLASREAFTRYGIDKPPFLSSLTFKVGKGKDGRDALLVHSTDAIPEPFVTFLVEVNWARGRLMREYTVLLDPPVYTPGESANSAAPVTAPTSAAPERRSPAAPRPRGCAAGRAPTQAPALEPRTACGSTAAIRSSRSRATCSRCRGTAGRSRSDDDRVVPIESAGLRRQHQYLAPGRNLARPECRSDRVAESTRGDRRSAPANGCLAQRRGLHCIDRRPSASGTPARGQRNQPGKQCESGASGAETQALKDRVKELEVSSPRRSV